MSDKLVFDFNALPEATRRRFVAACHFEAEPKPLFVNEEPLQRERLKYGVFAVSALVCLLGWAYMGLGERVDSGFFYWLCGAVLGGASLAMVAVILTGKRLPYASGTYVFPVDLVIAEGNMLTLLPLAGVVAMRATEQYDSRNKYTHTNLVLRFRSGEQRVLEVEDVHRVQTLAKQMHENQIRVAAAFEAQEMAMFANLDPFYEARTGGNWDVIRAAKNATPSAGPVARKPPFSRKLGLLVGAAIGIAIGVGVQSVRNRISDDRMFEEAVRDGSLPALYDYLADGGTRHADEVENVLIPKREFERALDKSSVTALREFRQQYPASAHDEAAKQAIHELFLAALNDFKLQSRRAAPEVLELMTAMFAWLEANDSPPVELRFRPPDPTLLAEVDGLIKDLPADLTGGMPVASVSPSFSDQRSHARETWIAEQLEGGFRAMIPADILDLELSERLPSTTDVASFQPSRATIVVSYIIDASGSIYANETNTQGYVGIVVHFAVTLLVPPVEGQPAAPPLTFLLSVEPPSEFSVTTDGIAIEVSDFLVYDVMAKKAFENLNTALRWGLFSDGEATGVQVVSGEIPALTPESIKAKAAAESDAGIVSDIEIDEPKP